MKQGKRDKQSTLLVKNIPTIKIGLHLKVTDIFEVDCLYDGVSHKYYCT